MLEGVRGDSQRILAFGRPAKRRDCFNSATINFTAVVDVSAILNRRIKETLDENL
jgi:hypothetical protein